RYVYVLDLPSEEHHKVSVQLTSDYHTVRTEFVKVSDNIHDYEISPDGKRAVFSARGEVITVPEKEGNTRNLTNSSGSHNKLPAWSPDGKWIAYISDETGEDELYMVSQDGSERVGLTTDGNCRRFGMKWSPNGKKLAFSDKNLKLYFIDIDKKETVQIDRSDYTELRDFSWSPDSRYLAYSKRLANGIHALFVYSFNDDRTRQITPGYTNDFSPVFDPDGKYLYFLSERNFNPILSRYDFEFVNNAITNLYLIILSADEKSPFAPESDEAEIAE
ncbi:unnamed protein product, partial [marine sediment metagenome]